MNTKEKQIKQWFEDWHYTILQQTIPIIEKGMEQKVMFNDFNKLNQVINLFLSTGTTTKYNFAECGAYYIDTVANAIRGCGIPYREILMDVCNKKKVN